MVEERMRQKETCQWMYLGDTPLKICVPHNRSSSNTEIHSPGKSARTSCIAAMRGFSV